MELKHRQYFEKQRVLSDIKAILSILVEKLDNVNYLTDPPDMVDRLEQRIIKLYEDYESLPDGECPPMLDEEKHIDLAEEERMQKLFNQILEKHSSDKFAQNV